MGGLVYYIFYAFEKEVFSLFDQYLVVFVLFIRRKKRQAKLLHTKILFNVQMWIKLGGGVVVVVCLTGVDLQTHLKFIDIII